jgi:putative DNA primase/helicase
MSKLNKFQERVLEHALSYAVERGWHVLPVSKNKKPLIMNWSKEASADERKIVKWWMEYPSANIGILTGPESGFWVVDTDNRETFNGLENLSNYFGDAFTFNSHKYLAGKTPTGGVHLLFQWDDDFPVKTTSNIIEGVDTRGAGGQIIVPPSSRNIDGEWTEYRWNNADLPVSPMQPWTYDFIKMCGMKDDTRLNLESVIKGMTEGQRDEQLNKFAWFLKGREISYELALGFMMVAAERCSPKFDPLLAKEKVDRAYTTEDSGKITNTIQKLLG